MNESDLLSEIIKRAQRWGRHTSIEDAKSEIRPYTSAYRASLLSEIEQKVEPKLDEIIAGLESASCHREACWEHDEDMGHDKRDFIDEEEWERVEERARDTLLTARKLRAIIKEAQEGER